MIGSTRFSWNGIRSFLGRRLHVSYPLYDSAPPISVQFLRSDRGRRRDEKVLISGALTLLTNAVIAYNTWKLHQVLERRRAAGRPVPSDAILAHIAPIGFRHINFHGVYRFPLERYLDRLLPSVPNQPLVIGT